MCAQYLIKEVNGGQLDNVEILMVDKSSHFEFICSNYKSLCEDDLFDYLTVDNKDAMESLNRGLDTNKSGNLEKEPVSFCQGLLNSVDPEKGVIMVDEVVGDGQENVEIPYDSLVICTGASYPSPWRDSPQDINNYDSREEECAKVREDIRKAKSILVIGGSVTGVESASYIAERYPEKKVGISELDSKLLARLKGAHE